MPRIRSIHPGLWTDEVFVSLSPFARLLFMGIWTECDDMGSFEWSPVKLKMRLLPADSVDVVQLLTELVEAGALMKYDVGGRGYGAVRNFCLYQRPKKPNSAYPQTDAVRHYTRTGERSKGDSSEPVGNQFGTGTENLPQMEEGGEKTLAIAKGATAPPIDPGKALFDAGVALLRQAGLTDRSARGLIGKWRKAHGDSWTREAIASAQGKSDPAAWIEGRRRTQDADQDEARAISNATAERYRRSGMAGPEDYARELAKRGQPLLEAVPP